MQRTLSATRTALLALPLFLALATGCKKEFDSPPVRTIPEDGALTIAELKALFQGAPIHFADSAAQSVYAVVTADEQSGNLYKNIFVQDHTGAIAVRLLHSGGMYQGDSIRIYLPGTVLSPYNGLMQLDSVDVDNNVVKQATGVYVAPTPTTISALMSGAGPGGSLQAKLITLSGVEFVDSTGTLTYADPVSQSTLNRDLEDCNGNTTIVRSSGYANFAGHHLPTGRGTFTGIASWFGSSPQLYIRNINEVQLNGPRCGSTASCVPVPNLDEDFTNTPALPGNLVVIDCWLNVNSEGSIAWRRRSSGGNIYAEAKPELSEDTTLKWLVTPLITFSSTQNLSFSSARMNWVHDGLTAWVSTDFSGDVSTATWLAVTGGTIAGSGDADNAWVPSGNIALSGVLPAGFSGTFVVAFKYQGDATNSTTYRVDNVQVN